MLKKRINYLCKINKISRKQLVEDTISLPHFSNILSGKMFFLEELAIGISEKLNVDSDYLLEVHDISDLKLKEIETLVDKVVSIKIQDDELLDKIPEKDNSLVAEIVFNLCKAYIYIIKNDKTNYERIMNNYLNFYLDEFSEEDISEIKVLCVAYYLFKIEYHRINIEYKESLEYLELLFKLINVSNDKNLDVNIYVKFKMNYLESLIQLNKFEEAKEIFEEVRLKIQQENALHHLSSLYFSKAVFVKKLGLINSALEFLSLSEENISRIPTEEKGMFFFTIITTRINILNELQRFEESLAQIDYLETLFSVKSGNNPKLEEIIALQRCKVYYLKGDFKELASILKNLKALKDTLKTEDSKYSYSFFEAILNFSNNEEAKALELVELCIPYFKDRNWRQDLEILYELKAKILENMKKYKESNENYKKLIDCKT